MRVLSLFSGIGGFDLGLERAGMEIVGQVEIDPYCRKVLAKHWPHVKRMEDIHDVRGDEFGAVDLVCGGFPCQPVSVAGKRQAQEDDRWLWPEFARIIRAIRPRYVLVENVTGLLDGPVSDVLGELAKSGYDAEWDCIPAAALGALHLRERVWILAYPHGERCGNTSGRLYPLQLPGRDDPRFGRDWRDQPGMDRVADGIPNGLDRRHALGNAVVPQIVTWIGERIMAVTP